ncbi:hypothetical protein [Sulfurimonas autotrophica]|uniref:Uncharacterized protein n=1 Tax=Sulfurimonas autotrophica (strain ATCC BAA-671 / DSM 16294 / JCM 11897 / OK10) TaxID=563040 RepID=E0UST2_SULAO|nr:hypothetical protein [Sulfurimonas autotrophica]ADN08109.1 hypothetical protein Saut_0060 [Sulfurimonas autotrophica DSM 16294]
MSIKGLYFKYILFNNIKIINIFLTIFWIVGVILGIHIVIEYLSIENENKYLLLSSLGIIISAFIASISLVKSIYENKRTNENIFLLEKLTICQELTISEFNELLLRLSNVSTALGGFINADDGEPTRLCDLGREVLNNFENRQSYVKLLWLLRSFFTHLSVDFEDTMRNIKQAKNINEVQTNVSNFLSKIDYEQLKYIVNKNKIKFKS